MLEEIIKVNWRPTSERPAKRALLVIETDQTTLRKVEFEYAEWDNRAGDLVWVFSYYYGANLDHIRVNVLSIKRWAYETDESLEELDQFDQAMVVDTLKTTVESLERRIAGARHELEKPLVAAEAELAMYKALRHLSGEIEHEERARR